MRQARSGEFAGNALRCRARTGDSDVGRFAARRLTVAERRLGIAACCDGRQGFFLRARLFCRLGHGDRRSDGRGFGRWTPTAGGKQQSDRRQDQPHRAVVHATFFRETVDCGGQVLARRAERAGFGRQLQHESVVPRICGVPSLGAPLSHRTESSDAVERFDRNRRCRCHWPNARPYTWQIWHDWNERNCANEHRGSVNERNGVPANPVTPPVSSIARSTR